MTTTTYETPDRDTLTNAIETALETQQLITVFARVEVEYEGRGAGGVLSRGDCVITVKPDGTILVHSDEKHRPRNWQTRGGTVFLDTTEADELTLNGRQSDPDENLTVVFIDVYNLTLFNTELNPSLELEGTEDDMHKYLLNNPDEIEDNFRPSEHEQVEVTGRIDIFGYDTDGIPVLVEVKRRQASHKHVDQLKRYVERYRDTSNDADVRGILVAPSASDNVKQTLDENELEFVALDPFDSSLAHPQNASITDF